MSATLTATQRLKNHSRHQTMSASSLIRLQKRGGRSDDYTKAEEDGTDGAADLKKKLAAMKKKRARAASSGAKKKRKKSSSSSSSSTSSTTSSSSSSSSSADIAMTATGNSRVRVFGCSHFRQHIICSTLSGRSLRLERIRDRDERPGLRPFEANFLRLMEKLTNGSQ